MSDKQQWILGGFLLFAVVGVIFLNLPAGAETWTSAGFESSPANGDSIAAGAGKIRDTRIAVRERVEIGHFLGGTAAHEDDDNGLHRIGTSRCYMQEAAPTQLSDSHSGIGTNDLLDFLSGGTGEGDLDNTASGAVGAGIEDDVGHGRCWIDTDGADGNTNDECTGAETSAGTGSPVDSTPTCCLATDVGTCDLDDNKMYTYLGVAGDAGSPPTGLVAGWQEVVGATDQVHLTPNVLTNGDFEFNATDAGTACDSTTVPSEWAAAASPTFTYTQLATEGEGCAVIITNTAGSGRITQTLNNLQANSFYRVTARVDATAANDVCTLALSGAASETEGVHTGTTLETIESTFTTDTSNVDDVNISLTGTDASDICTWDHVSVRRETRNQVTDAGIIAVYDTYTTSDGAAVSPEGTGLADVPELSISFNPPTPGWIVHLTTNISIGCDSATCSLGAAEGFACQIEKDGSAVSGTLSHTIGDFAESTDTSFHYSSSYIDINPMVATAVDVVYTVACVEIGTVGLIYNFQNDGTNTEESHSQLMMMAFPPH